MLMKEKYKVGKIVLLVLTGLCMLSFTGHKFKSEREALGYKGNVKFASEMVYHLDENKKQVVDEIRTYAFSFAGHLIEFRRFTGPGENTPTIYSSKDSNEEKEMNYRNKNGLVQKSISRYDANENEIEHWEYEKDTAKYTRTLYSYNSLNERIEEKTYYETGKFKERISFEYDKNGNMAEQVFWDIHAHSQKWEFKYDKKGNRIEEIKRGDNGGDDKTVMKYDEYDNLIEMDTHHSGNTYTEDAAYTDYLTYKYDANGNRTEEKELINGQMVHWYVKKFDEGNNEIESVSYSIEDSTVGRRYTFTYKDVDRAGNYLKQILFINDQPNTIMERKIEYYK